jgi:hypothetical protein
MAGCPDHAFMLLYVLDNHSCVICWNIGDHALEDFEWTEKYWCKYSDNLFIN